MIRPLWGVCLAMLTVLAAVASLPFPAAGIKTPGGGSINGGQEILADPARPMIYSAHPDGRTVSFLDAFTGNDLSRLVVGPGSADGLRFRASNGSDVGENPLHPAGDWDAGRAYLVSGGPYGIVVLAVSNVTQVGWLPMGAYPQGVALMRNRHVVIGVHRNFYDAALWVFNTTTGAERTTVPIPVSPGSGYVSEQSLLVASEVAGTALLWNARE